MVMPTGPTPDLIFIQADVALLGLELRLDRPTRRRHPRQGRQGGISGRVGKVIARLTPIQVLAIDDPSQFPRAAVAGLAEALGGKAIGAPALRPFRHSD